MAKLNLQARTIQTIVSKKVEISEPIEKAGKYPFKVVKAMLIDSRTNPDGSVKEHLPVYEDATPEVYLVLQDIASKRIHVHRLALASFVKFSTFSSADVRDNKLEKDNRDGYAMFKQNGKYYRIPAQEGEDGYEAVKNIFSRFVTAIGLPEGTTPEQCGEFVGTHFEGTLVSQPYESHELDAKGARVNKTRLKLEPNFKPLSEEALELAMNKESVQAEFE